MTLPESIQLISGAQRFLQTPQAWADLGCGSGLFARALTDLLPATSVVHAVDKEDVLGPEARRSNIVFKLADFEKENLGFTNLDGLLMANSLHYVADQSSCILQLSSCLRRPGGKFILIEYDSEVANKWVPFPVSFARAQALFAAAGFLQIEKIGERKSLYRRGGMYACVCSR